MQSLAQNIDNTRAYPPRANGAESALYIPPKVDTTPVTAKIGFNAATTLMTPPKFADVLAALWNREQQDGTLPNPVEDRYLKVLFRLQYPKVEDFPLCAELIKLEEQARGKNIVLPFPQARDLFDPNKSVDIECLQNSGSFYQRLKYAQTCLREADKCIAPLPALKPTHNLDNYSAIDIASVLANSATIKAKLHFDRITNQWDKSTHITVREVKLANGLTYLKGANEKTYTVPQMAGIQPGDLVHLTGSAEVITGVRNGHVNSALVLLPRATWHMLHKMNKDGPLTLFEIFTCTAQNKPGENHPTYDIGIRDMLCRRLDVSYETRAGMPPAPQPGEVYVAMLHREGPDMSTLRNLTAVLPVNPFR